MRYLILFSIFLIVGSLSYSQTPKREFRAAWIATVANIDWPSAKGLSSVDQQQQFISRIEKLKSLGCNAVIVQIRPCCDACYPSEIEPWSQYLTGKQGTAPLPFYDPVQFMITETHKRNMEFHAWFNPFRALMDCKKNPNPPSHVTKKHKDWIINYGGKSYLDPGNPQARAYVIQVILDVVKRYDIDAVHLDDYFYPYRIGKVPFGDNVSYKKFGKGNNRDDWRRSNVNLFIAELHNDIILQKPYVKLGISPFGVWRNSNKDPAEGSATTAGQTSYDDLYADVLLWMKNGWIDYLLPQLYWEHGNRAASFNVLLKWWNEHCYNRQIYYGLGVYRLSEKKGSFGVEELLWQIRDIRNVNNNTGFAFYSAISFDKATPTLQGSIKENYTKYPAFPPVMKWIDSIPPASPKVKLTKGNNPVLNWTIDNPQNEPLKYVIYRFGKKETINLEKTDKIIAVQQEATFTDTDNNENRHCKYVVTAMDRLWNESDMSNVVFER